jgi:hypothetical protein
MKKQRIEHSCRWSSWFQLTAAIVLAGCGASKAMAPAAVDAPLPNSPGEARHEMAQLERQIVEGRVALGLPARSKAQVSDDGVAESAGVAGEEAPRPVQAAPPPEPASDSVECAKREERDAPCDDSCRYTKAICHAAARICRLARFLEEEDARRRCRRAQQDCREAQRTTAGSCTGCD